MTEFGLQHKDRDLMTAQLGDGDSVSFEIEVGAEPLDESGKTKFRGSFVHGPPGTGSCISVGGLLPDPKTRGIGAGRSH